MTNTELPTLAELVESVDTYEKQDKFNFLMNQPPPKKWIAKHDYIKVVNEKGQKVPYEYLPIDKVEYLLRKIFKKYKIEILREGHSFNGVYVVVRVHYKDVVTGDMDFHDGIGAINLQVKSGTSIMDLANINAGALSMAYPHAKTLAVKDACDMFGKLFGSDLNRRDTLGASMDSPRKTDQEKLEEIYELMNMEHLSIPETERMHIERIVEEKDTGQYNKCLQILKASK